MGDRSYPDQELGGPHQLQPYQANPAPVPFSVQSDSGNGTSGYYSNGLPPHPHPAAPSSEGTGIEIGAGFQSFVKQHPDLHRNIENASEASETLRRRSVAVHSDSVVARERHDAFAHIPYNNSSVFDEEEGSIDPLANIAVNGNNTDPTASASVRGNASNNSEENGRFFHARGLHANQNHSSHEIQKRDPRNHSCYNSQDQSLHRQWHDQQGLHHSLSSFTSSQQNSNLHRSDLGNITTAVGSRNSGASPHPSCDRPRRRSSFTPQHQLDRRNSRRRVTSNSETFHRASTTNATVAPNRYYISGKSVQTEWSSPTRQRRSRHTMGAAFHKQRKGNSHNINSPPFPADSDIPMKDHAYPHRRSGSGSDGEDILVLPSISIPDGTDDYRNPRFASSGSTSHHQHQPPSFPHRRACVRSSRFCTVGTFKWCLALQIVLVLPLCLYIFDAHAQKRSAALRLEQYNEEHEHILNQMMWMDQAAKKVNQHRSIDGSRGNGSGASHYKPFENDADSSGINNQNGFLLDSYYADNSATEDLRDSVHKLRGQMRDMQYRIQQNSKARITEKYGEGKVLVYIHLEATQPVEVGSTIGSSDNEQQGTTKEIAIELFVEDTPHAVSTFLYQIERGHWDRVQMNWKSETSIVSKPGTSVTSAMGDWSQTSRLEFLEHFPIKHCEVSLVQQGQMGGLSLKINLVEVPFQEQEEVCIGRVVNDRMALPKSLGYFMAGFASTRSVLPPTTTYQVALPKSHHQIKAPPQLRKKGHGLQNLHENAVGGDSIEEWAKAKEFNQGDRDKILRVQSSE